MEAEELELFEHSLRAAAQSSGDDLDAALRELGWHEALSVDPAAAVSTLFRLLGEANATSSALGHVLGDALGVDDVLPVVMPALGRTAPPGRTEGSRVVVRGLATSNADRLLVVATGDETVVGTVAVGDLSAREIHGLDPSLGLVELTGDAAHAEVRETDWTPALARAQLAVGHELVGASRAMLGLAREHALHRIQFGQPIAKFQAVRHRLAETLVAIEGADAVLAVAWQEARPQTAAMAKALAGRAARTAARHCQQVLAGIGFTTEHDLHRYIRRVLVLDELFGSSARLTTDLGRDLLETGTLPPLAPL
ncbi:MAG TPA: acyl-CoA dehydrogenase family protein [Acidimicrobiia bacterium]|nr:acyl-CoA dehydrogenase family protein [Acidimicrobiia bacterium]